ncbi:hypothetical protein J2TS4_43720 [Paenibacillus sp. J2TS4]|nr:hypothetical protein J2TS4_43720 [Paenibacillus sp. J2TS4]
MILEIIATSVADAIAAERSGAHRLELCAAMSETGLTPSIGLIEAVVGAVQIPVNVIVRPHSRSFYYNDQELSVMAADIRHIKRAGAAGIVIGALTEEKKVDTEAISRLLNEAEGLDVTFHRAFDDIEDQLEALETIALFPQIRRILTAGGQAPAPQSAEQLKRLVDSAKNTSVNIMAGYGMTPESVATLVPATGLTEVHFGSAARVNRSFTHPIDSAAIETILSDLKRLSE